MSKLLSQPQKNWGFSFWCKQYSNSAQLFKVYTGFIRPCLEYCSNIWGSSPYTSLLNRVESKAIRLIGDPSLTLCLFAARWLLYLFSNAITLVTALMNWLPVFPPTMARPHSKRQATFAHNYCVELSNAEN